MDLKSKLNTIKNLSDYYHNECFNIVINYNNQMAIYLGFEDESVALYEHSLSIDALMSGLFEPIIENHIKINMDYERQLQAKKEYEQTKENLNNSNLPDDLEKLNATKKLVTLADELLLNTKKLRENILWHNEKESIGKRIFNELMPNNTKNIESIKIQNAILKSKAYEALSIIEQEKVQLINIQKNTIQYLKILQNQKTVLLKNWVTISSQVEDIQPNVNYQYINENGISDFYYIRNHQQGLGITLPKKNWKIAHQGDLLFYINKNGWYDVVYVKTEENGLLVPDDFIVMQPKNGTAFYLLVLLNSRYYREICFNEYKTDKNFVLNLPIVTATNEIAKYFEEPIENYFYYNKKFHLFNDLYQQTNKILKTQGEKAAVFFLEMEIEKNFK